MTNREWLLKELPKMSDEKLAEKLIEKFGICRGQDSLGKCSEHKNCISCYIDWLKAEHKKAIILTETERTILENIDKDYKWIARDSDGRLDVYTVKPFKDEQYKNWDIEDGDCEKLDVFKHLFQFVEWEDKEAYNIEELLKGD